MKIIRGQDLFNSRADVILVTGNSYIKTNGAVVMGRGAARRLKELCPGIDKRFGSTILHLGTYGVRITERDWSRRWGLFQVKYNFSDKANLKLIEYSTDRLYEMAIPLMRRQVEIAMNFPGIGNGRLRYEEVLSVVSRLPDCVSLYIK